jgi:ketosteroid isomerase-like protein
MKATGFSPRRETGAARGGPPLAALAALVTLALAGCSGGGGASARPAAPGASGGAVARLAEADRAAIAGVLDAQAEAWNRGDLEGYMAGYLRSPELVFTSGSKVRTGYDETFASYRQKYGEDRGSMGTLKFQVMRIDAVGEGGAVVLGRWDLQLASGPVGGVFSVVMERTATGWLILHDHTSSDPPAAP